MSEQQTELKLSHIILSVSITVSCIYYVTVTMVPGLYFPKEQVVDLRPAARALSGTGKGLLATFHFIAGGIVSRTLG